ncbi:MAG TPA: FAD:protein FMN transferase [bacterium]|nr:FAD:protein FMN transferase [bacterium]
MDCNPAFLEVHHRAMATEFSLLLYGENKARLHWAVELALEEIDRLEHQMSVFDITSEISGINARAAEEEVIVEPGLFGVLQFSKQIHEETGGAFDITIHPLVRAWQFFRKAGTVPDADTLAEALSRTGMDHVHLNPERRTVRFEKPGIEINLGGVGKGHAVDVITGILRRNGITSAFINAGGSTFYALGAPPERDGWQVGIRDPLNLERHVEVLHLTDRSLSTSGNYERFFTVEGKVYCHILNPRTGYPVCGMLSASVLAPTALETDASSTAFFGMSVEEAGKYCDSHGGISAILCMDEIESVGHFRIEKIGFKNPRVTG